MIANTEKVSRMAICAAVLVSLRPASHTLLVDVPLVDAVHV